MKSLYGKVVPVVLLLAIPGCFNERKEEVKIPVEKIVTEPKKIESEEPTMVTTASGLRYTIVKPAVDEQAKSPEKGKRVTVR